MLPITWALEYAHGTNIIHRDVKPSNILITESGDSMLTDFGIAKILDIEEGQTLTNTGVGVGTPEYMAPEQWLGHATIQSDIYSIGIVFFETITGHKPYTADTPAAVLLKQNNDPLPSPSKFVPDLPKAVEKVLFKALAKRPEDRYQGMADFAKVLEGLLLDSAAFDATKATSHQKVSNTATSQANVSTQCNDLTFIKDATIPDGTILQAGQSFIKTWEIKNTGSCSWTTAYRLLFSYGDRMGSTPINLPVEVESGDTIDISIQLKAPNKTGDYTGIYAVVDEKNVPFGPLLSVVIVVK